MTCRFCHADATHRVSYADGRGAVNVDERHIPTARHVIERLNKDAVHDVQELTGQHTAGGFASLDDQLDVGHAGPLAVFCDSPRHFGPCKKIEGGPGHTLRALWLQSHTPRGPKLAKIAGVDDVKKPSVPKVDSGTSGVKLTTFERAGQPTHAMLHGFGPNPGIGKPVRLSMHASGTHVRVQNQNGGTLGLVHTSTPMHLSGARREGPAKPLAELSNAGKPAKGTFEEHGSPQRAIFHGFGAKPSALGKPVKLSPSRDGQHVLMTHALTGAKLGMVGHAQHMWLSGGNKVPKAAEEAKKTPGTSAEKKAVGAAKSAAGGGKGGPGGVHPIQDARNVRQGGRMATLPVRGPARLGSMGHRLGSHFKSKGAKGAKGRKGAKGAASQAAAAAALAALQKAGPQGLKTVPNAPNQQEVAMKKLGAAQDRLLLQHAQLQAQTLAEQLGKNKGHPAVTYYGSQLGKAYRAQSAYGRAVQLAQAQHDTAEARNAAVMKAYTARLAALQARANAQKAKQAVQAPAPTKATPPAKQGPTSALPGTTPPKSSAKVFSLDLLDGDQPLLNFELLRDAVEAFRDRMDEGALVASADDAQLGIILEVDHTFCDPSVFCKNPLHPGPCKGWKWALYGIAPAAYHAIEQRRVGKINEKRAARVAHLQKHGLPVPGHLLKPVTYHPEKLKPHNYEPALPGDKAIAHIPTAPVIQAKIGLKHAQEKIDQQKAMAHHVDMAAKTISSASEAMGKPLGSGIGDHLHAQLTGLAKDLKSGESLASHPKVEPTLKAMAQHVGARSQVGQAATDEIFKDLKHHIDTNQGSVPPLVQSGMDVAKAKEKQAAEEAAHNKALVDAGVTKLPTYHAGKPLNGAETDPELAKIISGQSLYTSKNLVGIMPPSKIKSMKAPGNATGKVTFGHIDDKGTVYDKAGKIIGQQKEFHGPGGEADGWVHVQTSVPGASQGTFRTIAVWKGNAPTKAQSGAMKKAVAGQPIQSGPAAKAAKAAERATKSEPSPIQAKNMAKQAAEEAAKKAPEAPKAEAPKPAEKPFTVSATAPIEKVAAHAEAAKGGAAAETHQANADMFLKQAAKQDWTNKDPKIQQHALDKLQGIREHEHSTPGQKTLAHALQTKIKAAQKTEEPKAEVPAEHAPALEADKLTALKANQAGALHHMMASLQMAPDSAEANAMAHGIVGKLHEATPEGGKITEHSIAKQAIGKIANRALQVLDDKYAKLGKNGPGIDKVYPQVADHLEHGHAGLPPLVQEAADHIQAKKAEQEAKAAWKPAKTAADVEHLELPNTKHVSVSGPLSMAVTPGSKAAESAKIAHDKVKAFNAKIAKKWLDFYDHHMAAGKTWDSLTAKQQDNVLNNLALIRKDHPELTARADKIEQTWHDGMHGGVHAAEAKPEEAPAEGVNLLDKAKPKSEANVLTTNLAAMAKAGTASPDMLGKVADHPHVTPEELAKLTPEERTAIKDAITKAHGESVNGSHVQVALDQAHDKLFGGSPASKPLPAPPTEAKQKKMADQALAVDRIGKALGGKTASSVVISQAMQAAKEQHAKGASFITHPKVAGTLEVLTQQAVNQWHEAHGEAPTKGEVAEIKQQITDHIHEGKPGLPLAIQGIQDAKQAKKDAALAEAQKHADAGTFYTPTAIKNLQAKKETFYPRHDIVDPSDLEPGDSHAAGQVVPIPNGGSTGHGWGQIIAAPYVQHGQLVVNVAEPGKASHVVTVAQVTKDVKGYHAAVDALGDTPGEKVHPDMQNLLEKAKAGNESPLAMALASSKPGVTEAEFGKLPLADQTAIRTAMIQAHQESATKFVKDKLAQQHQALTGKSITGGNPVSPPKTSAPFAHPDMMAVHDLAQLHENGTHVSPSEVEHALSKPGVTKADFDKLGPAGKARIANLVNYADQNAGTHQHAVLQGKWHELGLSEHFDHAKQVDPQSQIDSLLEHAAAMKSLAPAAAKDLRVGWTLQAKKGAPLNEMTSAHTVMNGITHKVMLHSPALLPQDKPAVEEMLWKHILEGKPGLHGLVNVASSNMKDHEDEAALKLTPPQVIEHLEDPNKSAGDKLAAMAHLSKHDYEGLSPLSQAEVLVALTRAGKLTEQHHKAALGIAKTLGVDGLYQVAHDQQAAPTHAPHVTSALEHAADVYGNPNHKLTAIAQLTPEDFKGLTSSEQGKIIGGLFKAAQASLTHANVAQQQAHKLGAGELYDTASKVLSEGNAPIPDSEMAPHVQLAHDYGAKIKSGTDTTKSKAYADLTHAEYHSLPLAVQQQIRADLEKGRAKFLDPKKIQAVDNTLAVFGEPGEHPKAGDIAELHSPWGEHAAEHVPGLSEPLPKGGTTVPLHTQGDFKILSKAERGESGDGYYPGTSLWGKFGAAGVMIRAKGADGQWRYLMVQRGNVDVDESKAGQWQLPGGALEEKENPFQGAARETVEELKADPSYLEGMQGHGTYVFTHPSGWKYTSIAATAKSTFEPKVDGSETTDAKWFTKEELDQLDKEGKLVDPLAGGKIHQNVTSLFDLPTKQETEAKAAAAKAKAGHPKQLGNGKSIAGLNEILKSQIKNAYKSQPNGSSLNHTPESVYVNLLAIAHAYSKPSKPLSVLQVIRTIDEQHYAKIDTGPENAHRLEAKITDWLKTPEGKDFAAIAKPSPHMLSELRSEGQASLGTKTGEAAVGLPAHGPGPGAYKKALGHEQFAEHSNPTAQKMMALRQKDWTPDQISALKGYTSTASYINGYLRGTTSLPHVSSGTKKDAQHMQDAMRPIPSHTLLLRGTGWEALPSEYRTESAATKLVGKTISDPGFLSTSVDKPFSGSVNLEIEAPKGTMGAYVEGITNVSGEHEMILAAGTKLKILSVTPTGYGAVKIRARVVSTSAKPKAKASSLESTGATV